MGYRAHTIKQHREYGGAIFADWEAFTSDFIPAMGEQGIEITANDNGDYFEVPVEDIKQFIARTPDDDGNSIYPGATNKELRSALQMSIDESPEDYIAWEWF